MRRSRRLALDELAPYLLALSPLPAPLDWHRVFGNDHPVEVEVGFGKGRFLVTASQARPDVNFLGIEIARKYQLFTANRIAKRGLGNVRLVQADARLFLRDFVAPQSVQAVHIYFPDPWWKKRHLKRRVFTPQFAALCERILLPGGRLNVATDVEEYFGVITELLAQNTRLRLLLLPPETEPVKDLDFLTNFERKSLMAGRPIYRSVFERQ